MTQKQKMLSMFEKSDWLCVTAFMQNYIPDYRRRICDLKEDGNILEARRCTQHEHQSRNMQEWKLVETPQTQNLPPRTHEASQKGELHPIFQDIVQKHLFTNL